MMEKGRRETKGREAMRNGIEGRGRAFTPGEKIGGNRQEDWDVNMEIEVIGKGEWRKEEKELLFTFK